MKKILNKQIVKVKKNIETFENQVKTENELV